MSDSPETKEVKTDPRKPTRRQFLGGIAAAATASLLRGSERQSEAAGKPIVEPPIRPAEKRTVVSVEKEKGEGTFYFPVNLGEGRIEPQLSQEYQEFMDRQGWNLRDIASVHVEATLIDPDFSEGSAYAYRLNEDGGLTRETDRDIIKSVSEDRTWTPSESSIPTSGKVWLQADAPSIRWPMATFFPLLSEEGKGHLYVLIGFGAEGDPHRGFIHLRRVRGDAIPSGE